MKKEIYVDDEFKKIKRYYKIRNFKNKLILSIMLVLVITLTFSIITFLIIFNYENNYNTGVKGGRYNYLKL
ncbi:hypothetical protein SAMN02745163_02352 [Clostridium cavendishii DSM 21758]|uniref:Uncharacterized protein n=1 Tax=Clostridium cavendishii DSM 21758 TaxID=1121302 RepID=A0A1M6L0R5_9CLOT|nr:hypothetical protein [Clostridium cavendishii]SHJ64706.1 hypothetical protein SAMN02745163_02352 [Clostridium cavendishii DSM 21758]